jgi:hypothetical protein
VPEESSILHDRVVEVEGLCLQESTRPVTPSTILLIIRRRMLQRDPVGYAGGLKHPPAHAAARAQPEKWRSSLSA